MNERVARYGYWDLLNGQRVHCWQGRPSRYAVGHGPITEITSEEADRLLDNDDVERVKRGMQPRKVLK